MTHNWKEIWNRRVMTENGGGLEALMKLDGFDSNVGRIEAADWRIFAGRISERLDLRDGNSVFEIGCGGGAFLYALRERVKLTIGGLDYGAGLIDAARAFMPDGRFVVCEANALEIEPKYDYVLATSVFHYFDLAYAEEVLDRMVKKAGKAVAVLEVPDMATKAAAETMRRETFTQEEYETKYAGLMHTYYDRHWFEQQAHRRGYVCRTFDACVPNHLQNPFRFNTILSPS